MKKIDKLLIRSFLPPFVVTFFIALFVLIMQFLWTYIDDIIGKGVGFLIMVELLSYLSVSLIPTALPIAILISSVMVMGNLAERYELASMKSAGISLSRIMRPLMIVAFGISIFSFFCSNNIIPIANLQFKSRLYDIRKQKPALNLETGIFNDDFKGFVIHIGEKEKNNRDIGDIIIYDHTSNTKEPMHIAAKRGEMYNTPDGNYFVMTLYNGTQYQENRQVTKGKSKTYPFVRTSFKEWNKVFDLSEFNIKETDRELFDDHYTMLSIAQLRVKIDSLDHKIDKKLGKLDEYIGTYISIFKPDTIRSYTDSKNVPDSNPIGKILGADTQEKKKEIKKIKVPKTDKSPSNKKNKNINVKKGVVGNDEKHKKASKVKHKPPLAQSVKKPLNEYESLVHLFTTEKTKRNLVSKAQSYARNLQSQAKSAARQLDKYKEGRVKHIYELNSKFSLAFVCFIFLFIGAPMGAIVRKGGFGYPLLIAIVFFMVYIVLNVFCKKLAESFVLPPEPAAWIPCAILFPIGVILTVKAMNDSKLLDVDKYFTLFKKLFQRSKGTATN